MKKIRLLFMYGAGRQIAKRFIFEKDKLQNSITDSNMHSYWNMNGLYTAGILKEAQLKRCRPTRSSGMRGKVFIPPQVYINN
ncbi:MAG: hypothetical protein ABIQ88_12815 [Chitinophagaceae bacterium]